MVGILIVRVIFVIIATLQNGRTALHFSAEKGYGDVVNILIEKEAGINDVDGVSDVVLIIVLA